MKKCDQDSILDAFCVNGPEIQLEISVLTQEVIKSRKITGLTVRGVNETCEIPPFLEYIHEI